MFNPLTFIETKREGGRHDEASLKAFVAAILDGSVADYQAAAWLMATFFRGLDGEELRAFTRALADSGQRVTLPAGLSAVDKHSTGGVGDKTTLVLVPLVAACGLPVAKLSGPGLGFTGGTVDKLEAIPGFQSHLPLDRFVAQVEAIGCAVSGHSLDLAPAEGRFYALRDVTATVPSLPLIASSIVSKKLAGGATSFVFDVKCGDGAFMTAIDGARRLARTLVDLSSSLGRRSLAFVTDMDQPLGRWAGNASEVAEAIDVLQGKGPADTRELCLLLGGAMVLLGGRAATLEEGIDTCREALDGGKALEKMARLLEAQGASPQILEEPEKILPRASKIFELRACRDGYVQRLTARSIGEAVKVMGGGRMRKEDVIDPSVSVECCRKRGEALRAGEAVLRLHHNGGSRLDEARFLLEKALVIGDEPHSSPLLLERVDG